MHASILGDSYQMLSHPGGSIIPAALATAELEGASGAAFLAGLAAGYETQVRISSYFVPSTHARGFRASPIFAVFGAAVATGKMLGLTEDQLVAVPYSTAVLVEEFDDSKRKKGFVRITASIIVDKDNHKKIVIGRAGHMIKTIGTEARLDLQTFLGVPKVYLDLNVRVISGWRDQAHLLDELGVRSRLYTEKK